MSHYYDQKQDSRLNLKKIQIRLKDISFFLYSSSAVFSKDKLDRGSEILIENCHIEDGWSILDMGCGYGPVGITMKKRYPKSKVLMSDINERAVYLSKKNIKFHGLKDISARKSNLYDKIDEKFDTILTNPPQTAGKDVCFSIIEKSFDHLNKDGLLQLVARHNKGGKVLSKKMESIFGNVEEVVKKSGFRVYVSKKNQP